MARSPHRRKLSTTISAEGYEFLLHLVKSGRAASVAEAVDEVVARARRIENRMRLEQDTAAYFSRLSPDTTKEERELEIALGLSADEVNFDT